MTILDAMKIACSEVGLPHQVFNKLLEQNPIQDMRIPVEMEEQYVQEFRDALEEFTKIPVEQLEASIAELDMEIAERVRNN